MYMKLGLFADPHYADIEAIGNRRPLHSLGRLKKALKRFKAEGVEQIVCLGDLINAVAGDDFRNAANLKTITDPIRNCGIPFVFVPGNHDTEAFTPKEFRELLPWAEIAPTVLEYGGVKLLFADACYYTDGRAYIKGTNEWTNTMLPPEQLDILRNSGGECIIFIHQNLDHDPGNPHMVSNNAEIRGLLEASGRVKRVYQGHHHGGGYCIQGGIEYITLPAMCEGDDRELIISV